MNRMPLVRRVVTEHRGGGHRRVVIALAAALVVNLLAYAFIVVPLSRQVADVAGRDERAGREYLAAKQEHDHAAGTLTGKVRASTELATFYQSVLPSDVMSARRLVYLRLIQHAPDGVLHYSPR